VTLELISPTVETRDAITRQSTGLKPTKVPFLIVSRHTPTTMPTGQSESRCHTSVADIAMTKHGRVATMAQSN